MAEGDCEMKDNFFEVDHVTRIYRGEESDTTALKDVSFTVNEGEFISIIGASGCGKTSLLRMLAGLDPVEDGEIRLRGSRIGKPNHKMGYVFQQGSLYNWMTVEQNVAYGLRARKVWKKNRDRVAEFIRFAGLEGFEKVYPHQISGGMGQRVAICRALINEPDILLLDEPMGALDSFTRASLQDKLLELKAENNTTMILVTHDVDEAIYLSDRIVIMTPRPGRISEIMEIDMKHPRNRGGSEFMSVRRDLLEKFDLASRVMPPEYMI